MREKEGGKVNAVIDIGTKRNDKQSKCHGYRGLISELDLAHFEEWFRAEFVGFR